MTVELFRLRGIVQGVGMRPTVARVARGLALDGWVRNDAEGVLVAVGADKPRRDEFLEVLLRELPPLARVSSVERYEDASVVLEPGFAIVESVGGQPRTGVAPDAATCGACRAEFADPRAHRYRYPFTNCTHCGPRFTIVTGIPYDRKKTTMASFPPCPTCRAEYEDGSDRRFHAEPIACPTCGPRVSLSQAGAGAGRWQTYSEIDELDAVTTLLERGEIVALKGLGAYHLCCDATREEAVQRLRARKRRPSKPFALMARNLEMIERYCAVAPLERAALVGPEAPIVLLERREGTDIAPSVAPGQRALGFMLPSTPLHHLVLSRMRVPIVCTSGNLSEEPPCIEADEAHERLGAIADWFLDHDRAIAQRVDDSVAKLADGAVRMVRRARGYVPAALPLPPGFDGAPSILATGGQYKSTLCLLQSAQAVLSQHLGDLDEVRTFDAWQRAREILSELYRYAPERIAVDMHPDYHATRVGLAIAEERGVPAVAVQHHHAHIAACMAEHGVPRHAPPVLGIALDGLGFGDDGTLWGGEFFLATYASYRRVGTFEPIGLLGGDLASEEPWRNLYAHLVAELGWPYVWTNFHELEVVRYLEAKPRALLDQALASPKLSPRSSSCGRLFDAAAAALGLHRDRVGFEGQAAMALEQTITADALAHALREDAYRFEILREESGPHRLRPGGMWRSLLTDLARGVDTALLAARFHVALADAIVRLVHELAAEHTAVDTIVVSGGVWQNRILLELVGPRLRAGGLRVLVPQAVPTNDGGLALGQAVVAAAQSFEREGICA